MLYSNQNTKGMYCICMKKLTNKFINNFLKTYGKCLPIHVYAQLEVLKLIQAEKKPKAIKRFLELKRGEIFKYGNFTLQEMNSIIELYCKSDNKKISRLYKYKTTCSLPYLIGIDLFVNATLEIYPYPNLLGFPYSVWTERMMQKYIQLYFSIPKRSKKSKSENSEQSKPENSTQNEPENSGQDKKNKIKIPSQKTLYNILHAEKNRQKLNSSLEDTLQFLLNQPVNFSYYYIYFLNKYYTPSIKDGSNLQKALRYNHTFFSALISLSTPPKIEPIIYSISYNSETDYINLNSTFLRYAKALEKRTPLEIPVYFIKREFIVNLLVKYYNNLTSCPNYIFVIYDNDAELQAALHSIKKVPFRNTLKKIIEKTNYISQIKLPDREHKPEFLNQMSEILYTLNIEELDPQILSSISGKQV